ncbi:MAG: adenine deaminase [Candidatus Marinimicrobia bacterium]|nr:adenine deaminase [Candidatus Neomarinimicrobiota bacterium]
MQISGKIIDIFHRRIFPGIITIKNGRIQSIVESENASSNFILPGFIDGHIHIESSMLVPSEFARIASTHGTVATVSDPHEIANVMGIDGIEFMIDNANQVPFKFFFGAPSCVPATPFETAGGKFGNEELEYLLKKENILYLSEMMNVPGVLNRDPGEMYKIELAKKYGKQIDGHAPGLRGEDAKTYVDSGITTDHECVTLDEALEKIQYGMTIQIREGSATRDLHALMPLIETHPDNIMFCSDDRHPDNLVEGHINLMVKKAIDEGYDIFNILQVACINPVKHYGLDVGLLREGDPADFIVIKNLEKLNILATYVDGEKIAENGKAIITSKNVSPINRFKATSKSPNDFAVPIEKGKLKVIDVLDGQVITGTKLTNIETQNGLVISDLNHDILKITVLNRYEDTKPAMAFIHNFGLKSGAIASSVSHDSHNIIAVGTSDEEIANAVNLIIEHKGGVSLSNGETKRVLPLPVAGLMTDTDGYFVAEKYSALETMAKEMGSPLQSPFMTLSFMALLVIPQLKLSDKGLFDGNSFELVHNFTIE